MKDIGINLSDAYYNWAKNYQPGLKPGIDGNKVVGIKPGKIMLHLQPLHHVGGKNLLLINRRHNQVTEYPPLE